MKQFSIKFNGADYKVNYITDYMESKKVGAFLGASSVQNFGLDIETLKTCDHKKAGLAPSLSGISLVQLYDGMDRVFVFDVAQVGLHFFEPLKHKNFVAHYGTFEINHLSHNGFPNLSIGCSMLLSILVDRAEKTDFVPYGEEDDEEDDDKPHWKGYGLDAIIGRLFELKIDKKWQTHDWSARPIDQEALVYAALDSVLTYKITEVQFPKVKEYKMLGHYKILKDMQHVISDMELNGMKIDGVKHRTLISKWIEEQNYHHMGCRKYFGDINLNSTKQLGEWATKTFKEFELKVWDRTPAKKLAFGKNSLSKMLKVPAIKALADYKKTAKLLSTYGETLAAQVNPVTNRIHCSFTLGETRTGRLSSREPNLQNLPRESSMREIFVAEKGNKLIVADFNQIELRVAGEVSGDPVIRGAYAKGMDLHSIFASHIYAVSIQNVTKEQRQIAKSANFGTIYGMGAAKFVTYVLAATDGKVILDVAQAKHIIDSLWGLYKVYGVWCNKVRADAKFKGFVRTPMGKMRKLHPDETYTKAPNTIVQGGAFEVMGVAMNELRKGIKNTGINARLINSVHDEIIIECADVQADLMEVKRLTNNYMQYGMKVVFPKANCRGLADAKIVDNWGSKND